MNLRAPIQKLDSESDDDRGHQKGNAGCPLVSVVIVNTNERHHLERCLPSVTNQTYRNYEVIVVDNDSSDGSIEYISGQFPNVRVVQSDGNLGYPGANNLGFTVAEGDYLAVLNPDTMVDERWVEELVVALEADPVAGLATSKIFLMDDPSRLNTCGNEVNLTGLTFCRGVGELANGYSEPCRVTAVSGAAFMIRRSVIDEVGPFDADFVSYLEETDLSLRAQLAGHQSIYVPTSHVWHDYAFRFSEKKCFHIEKNRLYMLIKIFRTRTLLLLTPLLIPTELLIWGYMLSKGRGHLRQKWLSYVWLWRNRIGIRTARRRTQSIRRLTDKEILRLFVPRLPLDQLVGGVAGRALNKLTSPIMTVMSRIPLRVAD